MPSPTSPKAKARLVRAHIHSVALCRRGKNRIASVYKAAGSGEDGTVTVQPILHATQTFDEKGLLYAIAYAPDFTDADGWMASREVVEGMAHAFLSEGGKLNIEHDGKKLAHTQAYVAESFIIQKGDSRFTGWKSHDGREVPHEGSWGLVIRIEDAELRKAYRSGAWDGVSIEGKGHIVEEPAAKGEPSVNLEELIKQLGLLVGPLTTIASSLGTAGATGNSAVTASVQAACDAVKGLAETAKAEIAKSQAKPTDKPVVKEEPKVDPLDVASLARHRRRLLSEQLAKAVDLNDLAQVDALLKSLDPEGKVLEAVEKAPTGPLSAAAVSLLASLGVKGPKVDLGSAEGGFGKSGAADLDIEAMLKASGDRYAGKGLEALTGKEVRA